MSEECLKLYWTGQLKRIPADEKKTEWVATLVPRRKEVRRTFASIILRVTPAQWLVRQVELVEPKGDRTVIELSNIKIEKLNN